ncbi:MAG: hypothetical protein ACLPPF_08160 [Rhodomicrobium sp.]
MVRAYYDSKQVPIAMPIFIAITALARASTSSLWHPLP